MQKYDLIQFSDGYNLSECKETTVLKFDKLPFSPLLCESNRQIDSIPKKMKPKMQLFTISRAPVPCYLALFTISAVENILLNLNN